MFIIDTKITSIQNRRNSKIVPDCAHELCMTIARPFKTVLNEITIKINDSKINKSNKVPHSMQFRRRRIHRSINKFDKDDNEGNLALIGHSGCNHIYKTWKHIRIR